MATAIDVHAHEDVHLSMTEINVLFDSLDAAERAAGMVRDRRLHADDIQIWQPKDHPLWAYDMRIDKNARWARTDGLITALLGAILMAVVTVVLASDAMGVGRALFLGAFTGIGFGGLIGAMFGLQMAEPMDDDPLVTITPETAAHVLTFVTSRPTKARRAVMSAGGQLVSEPGHNLPVTS